MLRFQSGNQSQDGAFTASGRAEHTDELTLVRDILYFESDIFDGCKRIGAAVAIGLGDVLELDNVLRLWFVRLVG